MNRDTWNRPSSLGPAFSRSQAQRAKLAMATASYHPASYPLYAQPRRPLAPHSSFAAASGAYMPSILHNAPPRPLTSLRPAFYPSAAPMTSSPFARPAASPAISPQIMFKKATHPMTPAVTQARILEQRSHAPLVPRGID